MTLSPFPESFNLSLQLVTTRLCSLPAELGESRQPDALGRVRRGVALGLQLPAVEHAGARTCVGVTRDKGHSHMGGGVPSERACLRELPTKSCCWSFPLNGRLDSDLPRAAQVRSFVCSLPYHEVFLSPNCPQHVDRARLLPLVLQTVLSMGPRMKRGKIVIPAYDTRHGTARRFDLRRSAEGPPESFDPLISPVNTP
jgi:hypothetical protein